MGEGVDGGGRVTRGAGGLLVERGAVGRAHPGADRGAEAAEGEEDGDRTAADAPDGEDGDEGGKADDGQGGRGAGDVLAVGGQRQGAAAGGRQALGPGLAGGQQDHGRAHRAQEQPGRERPAAASAARGVGGDTGFCVRRGRGGRSGLGVGGDGTGLGYGGGTHVIHYPSRPHRSWSRLAVWTARSTAAALLRHSLSSATGSESATTPAPACTYAVPSRSRAVRMAMAVSESPAKSR